MENPDTLPIYASRRPLSYKNQSGCHNCAHCFVKFDHDQGPEYFCGFSAEPRPPCRSVAMNECELDDDDFSKGIAWDLWSGGREVEAFGICIAHEPRKEGG